MLGECGEAVRDYGLGDGFSGGLGREPTADLRDWRRRM